MKLKLILASFFVFTATSCSDEPAPKQNEATHGQLDESMLENAVSNPLANIVAVDPKPDESIADRNELFEAFKENLLNKTWELNPSFGVYVGFYKYDHVLMVPNGEHRAFQREFLATELQALKQFDANQLSTNNATDLAIIEGQLRSQIWYIDVFRAYEWNPAQYNPAGAFGVILNTDYKPLSERLAAISNRLKSVPDYYQAALDNLKIPTIEHIDLAIQQSGGTLNMFEKLISAKAETVELDPQLAQELSVGLVDSAAAVKNYINALESKKSELLASGEARSFRIGAEIYEKKFQHDIKSNYTAEELYQLALNAKQTLHLEMIGITQQLWPKYFDDTEMPSDSLVAVKQMIDHLSSRHVEREDFVDEIRRQIPVIQKFMDDHQLLDSDPTRPLVVRLTPEYQRGFAGASVNAPGPYDATANTYYNVSPLDAYTPEQAESYLREYNHWILQILNIHEAIPGHYTQLMHANKSPSKIKSIFSNGAMVEGWAVYSERMMLENGYGGNEPEMWLMYSKWNLRVVVNTILDYSIQVLGLEKEAGLDLLMNEAFQERTEAEGKWRRATISQVQLTSYFTGYSEIYAFREELKKLMGESFDLKAFHNKFLSYGSAPVPVIRNSMLTELGLSPDG